MSDLSAIAIIKEPQVKVNGIIKKEERKRAVGVTLSMALFRFISDVAEYEKIRKKRRLRALSEGENKRKKHLRNADAGGHIRKLIYLKVIDPVRVHLSHPTV